MPGKCKVSGRKILVRAHPRKCYFRDNGNMASNMNIHRSVTKNTTLSVSTRRPLMGGDNTEG